MHNPPSFFLVLTSFLGCFDPPYEWAIFFFPPNRLLSDHFYILVYGGYLWFQLYSHANLYKDEGDDVAKSTVYSPRAHHPHFSLPHRNRDDVEASTSMLTGTLAAEAEKSAESKETSETHTQIPETQTQTPETQAPELETPQMTIWVTIFLLAVVTVVSYVLYIHTYLSH